MNYTLKKNTMKSCYPYLC